MRPHRPDVTIFPHTVTRRFSRLVVALAASTLILGRCFAQNGDHPNETQQEVVPRDKIPPAPVLSPEEELKSLTVAPGFHVELVASEPLVTSPVAMQFDQQGRLWVVEMNGYMPNPEGLGEQVPNGNIVVLEDTNGDGRMDKRTVFLDHLTMPRSLMLFRDGVVFAEPPRLWFARDTDGDGRADERFLVAENYANPDDPKLGVKANPEHASNSLLWAMDNWVYSANHTLRYRWRGGSPTNWVAEETIFRGQWGLSQDNSGRLFYNSNSDQLRGDLLPSRYLARNPNLRQPYGANVQLVADQRVWPARVNPGVNRGYQPGQLTPEGKLATYTAACGPVVYRGDQFGPEFVGDAFLCEPSANMIRRNRILNQDGILTATNAYDHAEFITATDERFRPVNLANGPDGTMYIVDLYRGLIQHRIYLTSYLRKQTESRNLQAPVNLGRIWRVVRTDRPVSRHPLPAKPTPSEWVQRLSHPNGWWRDLAQQRLVESRDVSLGPVLRDQAQAAKNPSALGRMHALWVLEGLGLLDLPTLQASIDDPDSRVRTTGLRLAETLFTGPDRDAAVNLVLKRAGFIPGEEQVQLLLTLGEIRQVFAEQIMKVLLMNQPANRLRFEAAISGLGGRELEFLESMVQDPLCSTMRDKHAPLLSGLARCIAYEARPDRVEHLLTLAALLRPGDWQQLALLEGLASTVPQAKANQPAPNLKPIRFEAEPKALANLRSLESPEARKSVTRFEPILTWTGKPGDDGGKAAVIIPLSGDDAASFNRGKELYTVVCGACHQPHGNGQEGLAPPLRESEWALGSEQRLIRIALHGVRDDITVKGSKYTLNMPALGEALTDEQIADALTYIRHEWGHSVSPVNAATVKAVRAATAKREDSWTEPELVRIP
jgi:mono/diheme cytochrome c family protein/glucose/arabinose dehydrogenase